MSSFKDSNGVTWDLTLTLSTIKRVKQALEIDLVNMQDGEPPLSVRLQLDLVMLFDVLFQIVKPQAEQRNITEEQFGEALGGNAAQAANAAFWGSLVDFFRQLQRTDLVAQLTKQAEMVEGLVEMATTRINSTNAIKTAEEIERKFGRPSTNGLESSESILDHSASEN